MEGTISSYGQEMPAHSGYMFQDHDIGRQYSDKADSIADEGYVLILDPRTLDRECLARCLLNYDPALRIVTGGSVEEWSAMRMPQAPAAVILILGSRTVADTEMCQKIASLTETFRNIPVVVIADSENLDLVVKAVESGAKGYIPSSVSIGVAAEAIALARAGGVFIPASCILAVKDLINSVGSGSRFSDLFTAREIEVAEALRRGKANKIIAYEMDLCESTVKVHIRNIMKKLHASNRTEVAFKLRGLMR